MLGAVALLLSTFLPSAGAGKKVQKDPSPYPAVIISPSDESLYGADTENGRKADYIFMEAQKYNAADASDSYYELLNAAYDLDTTSTSVGMSLGYYKMALGQTDSVMALKGFNMMRRHFDLHPDDYYSAIFYGMINTSLGNNDEAVRVWTIVDSLNPSKPDVAIKLVEALQTRSDTASLRKSLRVLDRVERAEGKDIGITSHKIRSMLAMGDTTGSVREIHDLLASSPRNSNYRVYAGDIFMALHQPDSAIRYYDLACAADSANGLAYIKRAQYYVARGDSAAYEREVEQALRSESLEYQPKMEMLRDYVGRLYADTLRRQQVRGLFESLLEMYPHESDIRDLYSSYLVVSGDLRSAAEQQEYAVDSDVSNPRRWASIMGLYAQLDEPQTALKTGERALEFVPDDPVIHILMGGNYQALKEYDKAMKAFRDAEKLIDPSDKATLSEINSAMGDVFYARQQSDSAFAYYEKAVSLNPDNLLALNNFAYYLAENDRDLDRAERYSAVCVRANPDNDTAIDTYAWIFYKKKNYEKAREWIDRALDIEGDKPQADVLDHAGDIYFMNREVPKAVEFWEKALKLNPDNEILRKKVRQRTPFVN